MIAIRIKTTNDHNGNPRRGWIIVGARGETVAFVDEGYLGREALDEYRRTLPSYARVRAALCELEVPVKEYHAQLHAQKARDAR